MNQKSEFITTKEYKRFIEFCSACKKENYIGLCYGPAGVGKSMAAYHFAQWFDVLPELQRKATYSRPLLKLKMDSLDTVIYTPEVSNSSRSIYMDISKLTADFNHLIDKYLFRSLLPRTDYVKLLIIDEADRLQPKSLEQVRDIYDRRQISIILIGMPGIEKRLIRFPQLYSRIGFAHAYKPLSEEEVAFIIRNHLQSLNITIHEKDFADQEAIASFTRITQGNFRLINRLLQQTIRVLEINRLSSITKEVVEAARECLVIGNLY